MVMMGVTLDRDVLISKLVNVPYFLVQDQLGQREWFSSDLQFGLFKMIEIQMAISACPNKFTRVSIHIPGHHAR